MTTTIKAILATIGVFIGLICLFILANLFPLSFLILFVSLMGIILITVICTAIFHGFKDFFEKSKNR